MSDGEVPTKILWVLENVLKALEKLQEQGDQFEDVSRDRHSSILASVAEAKGMVIALQADLRDAIDERPRRDRTGRFRLPPPHDDKDDDSDEPSTGFKITWGDKSLDARGLVSVGLVIALMVAIALALRGEHTDLRSILVAPTMPAQPQQREEKKQ